MKQLLDPFNVFGRPVSHLTGAGDSAGLSIKLVSTSSSSVYFARRFLGGGGREQHARPVSLVSLLAGIDKVLGDSDLLIARVSPRVSQLFARHDVIRLPERIRFVKYLPESPELRRQIKRDQANNLRRIRKYGFTYELSQSREDFEFLWHRMILPYAAQRFGDLAEYYTYEYAVRVFKHGRILWILQDGQRVAGALLGISDQNVHAVLLGTEHGDGEPIRKGAFGALYHFVTEWAQAEGFRTLDLGTALPCLADGVFDTKRRWGGRIIQDKRYYDLVIYWRVCSPVVRRFLYQSPLVIRDRDGLSAITATTPPMDSDPAAVEALVERCRLSGLTRAFVLSDLESYEGKTGAPASLSGGWLTRPAGPRDCVSTALPVTLEDTRGLDNV
jgi:hypothetical protein